MYYGNHGERIQRDEDPRDGGDRGEHPNPRTPFPTHEYYNPDQKPHWLLRLKRNPDNSQEEQNINPTLHAFYIFYNYISNKCPYLHQKTDTTGLFLVFSI